MAINLAAVVYLFLTRTYLGKALRAAADDTGTRRAGIEAFVGVRARESGFCPVDERSDSGRPVSGPGSLTSAAAGTLIADAGAASALRNPTLSIAGVPGGTIDCEAARLSQADIQVAILVCSSGAA